MKAPLTQSLNLCLLIQFWNPPFIPLGSTKMRKKVFLFILNIESIILQFVSYPFLGIRTGFRSFLHFKKGVSKKPRSLRFCFLKAEGAKPPTKTVQALNQKLRHALGSKSIRSCAEDLLLLLKLEEVLLKLSRSGGKIWWFLPEIRYPAVRHSALAILGVLNLLNWITGRYVQES